MKEYTITYTAEVTDVFKGVEPYEWRTDPEEIARFIKEELEADDVHVKNVKVFER